MSGTAVCVAAAAAADVAKDLVKLWADEGICEAFKNRSAFTVRVAVGRCAWSMRVIDSRGRFAWSTCVVDDARGRCAWSMMLVFR